MSPFKRLVRFEASDGKEYFGEAPDLSGGLELIGTDLPVYDDPFDPENTLSSSKKTVARILSPIPRAAHIYGVGLNYKAHAQEANVCCPCANFALTADHFSCQLQSIQ